MSNSNYGRPTQEESEQLHRDSMDSSFGRAEHPDDKKDITATTSIALVCKQVQPKYLDASTQVTFISLVHVSKDYALDKGALLLELDDPESGEVGEVWMPKKLCSNLDMDSMTVYIWTPFLEDKYPLLVE